MKLFLLAFMLSSFIISDTVPFGWFFSFHEQCTGSNISGVCENGRWACTKGFTFTDLACEKSNDMQIFKKGCVRSCLTLQMYYKSSSLSIFVEIYKKDNFVDFKKLEFPYTQYRTYYSHLFSIFKQKLC